jgi:tetratricopeptide (TPR) repeat protein
MLLLAVSMSVALVSRCRKEDPGTAGLFFEAGANALREGRNLEAIDSFERAKQLDPNHAETYYGLGLAYKNTGAFDKAIVEMEKSLQTGTHYDRAGFAPRAHYQLGTLYRLRNANDKAIEHWKAAVGLRPGFFEARNNLAVTYYQLGRYDESIEEWRSLLRTPGYATPHVAHSNLSAAYRANGKLEDALTEARMALEVARQLEVEYPAAYRNLGLAYAELGAYNEAVEAYRQALRTAATSDVEVYYYLGVANEGLGNKAEALKAYRHYRDNALTSEKDEEVKAAIGRVLR